MNRIKDRLLELKLARDQFGPTFKEPMPEWIFENLLISSPQMQFYANRAKTRIKGCWADTFVEFNNLGKLLHFQIEFLGKDSQIYKKVKQNDAKEGFNPEKMPTLYVCENSVAKLKYLKDHANIGFNSPILTKAEYFTLMKAWWYAYAEMTNDGLSRNSFSFQSFITNLAAKADDWHVDTFTAQMIMGSFGYGIDENNFGYRFTGNPVDDTNGNNFGVFKWKYTIKKKTDEFNYGTLSSDIALDFTTFLYISGDEEMLAYIRYHLWKPTWDS